MDFDPYLYRYNSKRNIIYSKYGAIAASHPIAAQIGLNILSREGNAVDAAIATAIALTVFEPTSNGIGGDAFSIMSIDNKVYGINGSGKSPSKLSYKYFENNSISNIPEYGWIPVTVPGAPGTWASMHKRFGKIEYSALFEETIKYCNEGFPVSPTVAFSWHNAWKHFQRNLKKECFRHWFDTFTISGRSPKAGEIIRLQDHGRTLEKIAESYSSDFYNGEISEKIIDFSNSTSGFLSKKDLADYSPQWINPISAEYNGYDILEIPPNTQGIITLIAIKILRYLQDKDIYKRNAETFYSRANNLHYEIEALKAAFHEASMHIADINFMKIDPEELLDENYIENIANSINDTAKIWSNVKPSGAGTVYLACHDKFGNMVSYIQSNYMGFGSGLVVPGTGIALHNRGHNFNLIKGHPNAFDAGKKPYHTIIPGFIMKNNIPLGAFGVMGAFMQPQGHIQVLLNLIDHTMNPQEALDAPRWRWIEENSLLFEHDYDINIINQLIKKGHKPNIAGSTGLFGRGQIILKTGEGSFSSGTEKRCDGHIAVM